MHNVSQWTNLRHLGEPLGGAEGLLDAVSFKKTVFLCGFINLLSKVSPESWIRPGTRTQHRLDRSCSSLYLDLDRYPARARPMMGKGMGLKSKAFRAYYCSFLGMQFTKQSIYKKFSKADRPAR